MSPDGRQSTKSPANGETAADSSAGGLLRSAGTVGGMTAASRVLGLVRDVALSNLLGAGTAADAWSAAFLLPNTMRRLVGEGNISAAFIPVFTRLSEEKSDEESWRLAGRFYSAVLAISGALSLLGILLAPWIVSFMFHGYGSVPGKIELTVALTRAVFGYLLLISLTAVLMGALNARRRFAAAAFTPVLLNLAIIAGAFSVWGRDPGHAVWGIAAGAMVGGLLQFVFLVPFARRLGMSVRPVWPLGDPDLTEILRLMIPGVVGAGVVQINILVGRYLASELAEGSITSLYYASRLNELTLGVFAVSIATVVLPLMSRQGARSDLAGLRRTLRFAIRQVSVVTVPATIGLILLRSEIVATLFEHGEFDQAATALTTAAVWGYASGLAAVAAVRIVVQAFYALRDTRTPVLVAAAAMLVNVVACLLLRGPLQNAGIALGNSIAAAFSVTLLLLLLRHRLGALGAGEMLRSLARVGVAAGVMGLVIGAARPLLPALGGEVLRLVVLVALGAISYVAALAALRAPELGELRQVGTRRLPDTLTVTDRDDREIE